MDGRIRLIEILSKPIFPKIGVDPAEVVAEFLLDNDVAPIVRCKDCRMFVDNKEAFVTYCRRGHKDISVNPNDFCSYGERKSDENKC